METGKVKSHYSGFVIIRLTQEASPSSESPETLQSYCAERKLTGLAKLLDSYDIKETRQLVRALPASKIRELEKQAAQSPLPPLNSMSAYWKLDIRKVAKKKSEEFVEALNAQDEVDFAYLELEATDPAVNAGNDPFNASQNYQDAAPVGIDARWAWTQLNGEGAGVGFVDLEQGWFLNHEDYTSKTPTLLSGDNRDGIGGYVGDHGTAVLGEVSADDNTIGIVGIAPSATTVNVTSHWDTASNSSGNVADAIVGAAEARAEKELPTLSGNEYARYSRHLILPEVGLEGQRKLKNARVLMIGTGGLGSPLGLYLAAAGVGTIGIVDFDVVDESNLQRQIIHGTKDVGRPKIESAKDRLLDINPNTRIEAHETRLTSENALELFKDFDVVVDGTDNFPTRYLVNDACVLTGKPNVYGSIFRFEGQASVFWAEKGACYRCLYPEPPPPGLVPSCAEGGVLGVLP